MLESLWTEREQLRALAAAIQKDAAEHWLAGQRQALPAMEAEWCNLQDRCFDDLEAVISKAEPRTLEDAAIQARLLAEYIELGQLSDDRDLKLALNLAAGLERLAGRPEA
jgi:hypothetical protein